MRGAVAEGHDLRPVFDSEHGPIHTFKDRHKTLPESFDGEYFRHMQWAHLASGGAGGGMRWPNRNPHCLTAGMRRAQKAMADFLLLVNWTRFRRQGLEDHVFVNRPEIAVFAGDGEQAVLWLLRTDTIGADGMLREDAEGLRANVRIRGLDPGTYRVVPYDTRTGRTLTADMARCGLDRSASFAAEVRTDLAIAIRKS